MMNSTFSYLLFAITILSIVLMANGCVEEEVVLSRSNKLLSDSIVRVQTKLIKTEVDSMCGLVYQENFDRAVDSVSAIRLQEIEKYIPTK